MKNKLLLTTTLLALCQCNKLACAQPLLDDFSSIFGKVFEDKNRNGIQDSGEHGIPGVRLATVTGLLIETDAHGRFHIDSITENTRSLLQQPRNTIVKVDQASLPIGAVIISENPRVVRIGHGSMSKINFAVRID